MKIQVNRLTVTLHLKVGTDVTLQDTKNDNIASRVLYAIQHGEKAIYIGDDLYISSRDVMSAKVIMKQYDKRVPDPCPSDDPCSALDPPTIIGVPSGTLLVGVGEEFDPLDGITAYDGYGEEISVSVEIEGE